LSRIDSESEEEMAQRANEVTAAIIHYLAVFHSTRIESMKIFGMANLDSSEDSSEEEQGKDFTLTSFAVPAEIGQLSNLKTLVLNSNYFGRLPSEIGQLTNLEELTISSNRLTTLPAEIGNLTNLQILKLSSNAFKSIPLEAIFKLTNLKKLDLSNNLLKSVPEEFSELFNKLSMLQEVKLDSNKLKKLPLFMWNWFDSSSRKTIEVEFNNWIGTRWVKKINESENIGVLRDFIYRHADQEAAGISLSTLLIRYIQTHPDKFKLVDFAKFPEELRIKTQGELFEKLKEYDVFKDIILFKTIKDEKIPFYIDYRLATKIDIEKMLKNFEGEQFYLIPRNKAKREKLSHLFGLDGDK
jgi:Leucine-rich repeat (LRR) protein